MSLFEQNGDNCQEAKPQRIEKMLWKMAVLHFISYITIKRGGIGGLHEIHWRSIRKAEESKAGKPLGLDKKLNDRHILLFRKWVCNS